MFNCPLTGQICNEVRTFMISETVGEFTQTTACCRKCSVHYIDHRNKVAAQKDLLTKAHQNGMSAQGLSAAQKLVQIENAQQPVVKGINLPEVIGQILGVEPMNGKYSIQKVTLPIIEEIVKCGKCGSTINDIIAAGKFGCAECYKAFDKQIVNGIGATQKGANQHVGKVPKKHSEAASAPNRPEEIPLDVEGHIAFLRGEMDRFTKEEQYEKAAQCRDLITKLGGDPKPAEAKEEGAGSE